MDPDRPPAEQRHGDVAEMEFRRQNGSDFRFRIRLKGRAVCTAAFATGAALGVLYLADVNPQRSIRAALRSAFGAGREDRNLGDINIGSLLVDLHCHTAESFLQFLEDYESGKIRDRLIKELLNVEIKVEGLTVEIDNMTEAMLHKEELGKRPLGGAEQPPSEESMTTEELDAAERPGRQVILNASSDW